MFTATIEAVMVDRIAPELTKRVTIAATARSPKAAVLEADRQFAAALRSWPYGRPALIGYRQLHRGPARVDIAFLGRDESSGDAAFVFTPV